MRYAVAVLAAVLIAVVAAGIALWPTTEVAAQPSGKKQLFYVLPPAAIFTFDKAAKANKPTKEDAAVLFPEAESVAIKSATMDGWRIIDVTNGPAGITVLLEK